ncbi:MAG: DUF177 domain-containing protein [Candidatus Omnitrophota bacterium]
MKIEVGKITEEEIELEEDINAVDWDLDSFDVKFIDKIHLVCKFKRIGREIMVEAKVSTNRDIICSRCLRAAKHALEQDFMFLFNVNELGTYLDANNSIREEMLLGFPMKVLCSPDCKGVCPVCKANLNIEACKCKDR